MEGWLADIAAALQIHEVLQILNVVIAPSVLYAGFACRDDDGALRWFWATHPYPDES